MAVEPVVSAAQTMVIVRQHRKSDTRRRNGVIGALPGCIFMRRPGRRAGTHTPQPIERARCMGPCFRRDDLNEWRLWVDTCQHARAAGHQADSVVIQVSIILTDS